MAKMKLSRQLLPIGISAAVLAGGLVVFKVAGDAAWRDKLKATLPSREEPKKTEPSEEQPAPAPAKAEPAQPAQPPVSPPPAPQPVTDQPPVQQQISLSSSAGTDRGKPIKEPDPFSLTCRTTPSAVCSVTLRRESDGKTVNLDPQFNSSGTAVWNISSGDLGGGTWRAEAKAGNAASTVIIYIEARFQAL